MIRRHTRGSLSGIQSSWHTARIKDGTFGCFPQRVPSAIVVKVDHPGVITFEILAEGSMDIITMH